MRTEWQINDYIPDPNTGKDRWQIYKILKGGMGVVYIVYDTEWREAFAVKTYQDRLQSEYAKEQFKKEAHVWINLDRHENIAWARFVENIHNRLYLFLEYVPGGDLSRWIGTKRLDLKQILLFALQFCYGMEHALSKGVKAHRDIKPQNCLVTENDKLKITDFGLAKALDTIDSEQALHPAGKDVFASITTTRTEQVGGTLPYMAPEQFDDLKHVDVKADIYAFGIMLYEMICGKLPFLGSNYSEFREKHQKAPLPDLPPFSIAQAMSLADIVQRCMAKNPWERYADFSHLRSELTQLFEIIFREEALLPRKAAKLSAINLADKGAALAKLGRYEEAISCYEHALEIDPKDAGAWSNKGATLGDLGRYEEMIFCCDHALEIDPKLAAAWCGKGIALGELGRYEEAIACYEHALEIEPRLVEAWSNKGTALGNWGRYHEAITCYERALEIDPTDTGAWYNKGTVLGYLGRCEEEITCYDHALEIDPKDVAAWSNKGVALANLGRYEEAIFCHNHALEINPRFADDWHNKSVALGNLRRYEEAITCCDYALEINPKHPQAWYNKGAMLGNQGHMREALRCFQRAQQLGHPQAAQYIEICEQCLYEQGQ